MFYDYIDCLIILDICKKYVVISVLILMSDTTSKSYKDCIISNNAIRRLMAIDCYNYKRTNFEYTFNDVSLVVRVKKSSVAICVWVKKCFVHHF